MSSSRPEAVIKVYPKTYYEAQKFKTLQFLLKTNALVLKLQESVSGNVFNTPYPFITFKRISSSDKLPKNLKFDGDPLSDYFVTLKTLKNDADKSGSSKKSGFIILAYKVIDDDRTYFYDQTWETWSGGATLSAKLSHVYEIRKIVCFKGVNVVPDVFKYIVMIEFFMDIENGQNDNYARDCMQRFRINRMSGYAALYTDCTNRELQKMKDEEAQKMEEFIEIE